MEQGGGAPDEVDREDELPEQIPPLVHPEYRPYTFNHEVGIDMFEIIDLVDMRSLTLDAISTRVTLHTSKYGP